MRRLYFALGDGTFFTMDALGVVEGTRPGVVVVVLTVVGIRCVGVDEPKAIMVDFVCITRLMRVELVKARRSTVKFSLVRIRSITWAGSKQGLNPFECRWFRCCVNGVERDSSVHCTGVHSDSSKRSSIE